MKHFAVLFFLCLAAAVPATAVFASVTDGTIDATYKNAWGENTGWLDFGTAGGNIHVTDSGLTGDIWSDNFGWINLNPARGGVTNNSEGTLSGSAWGENVGWIDFSGVVINSSGQFTGTATGNNTGTVNFDCTHCKVVTDWRPASSRVAVCGDTVCNGSETCSSCPADCGSCPANLGSGPYFATMPQDAQTFSVTINSGSVYANTADVTLRISGGEAVSMDISNYSNFQDAVTLPYANQTPWTLLEGDGQKTVYARFHNSEGQTSSVVSAQIVLSTKFPDIAVYPFGIFSFSQPVIISGTTDPLSQLTVSFDGNYGGSQADSQGNWSFNLGTFAAGTYPAIITATNPNGNSRSVSISIIVQAAAVTPPVNPPVPPQNPLQNLFGNILPKKVSNAQPLPLITVTQKAPAALSGLWNLLPVTPIK